jgi:hypothetical protein
VDKNRALLISGSHVYVFMFSYHIETIAIESYVKDIAWSRDLSLVVYVDKNTHRIVYLYPYTDFRIRREINSIELVPSVPRVPSSSRASPVVQPVQTVSCMFIRESSSGAGPRSEAPPDRTYWLYILDDVTLTRVDLEKSAQPVQKHARKLSVFNEKPMCARFTFPHHLLTLSTEHVLSLWNLDSPGTAVRIFRDSCLLVRASGYTPFFAARFASSKQTTESDTKQIAYPLNLSVIDTQGDVVGATVFEQATSRLQGEIWDRPIFAVKSTPSQQKE